ncbi:MAG: 3'-5' exonuclease domain-containing protein 2, partial [Bacteroidaceae bacterium]|nr:3'-5' exonuclease domain-containing protein 2 [Bacteroidaceae bacterium]
MKIIYDKYDKRLIPKLPRVQSQGRIFVIFSQREADRAVDYLMQQDILGFDTETRPSFRKGQIHQVALLQVATHDTCFLFRLNRMGIPPSIQRLLEDQHITKVGLSLQDALRMLRLRSDFIPGTFIELQKEITDIG